MEPELTAPQACRQHLLTPEDYARMCDKDGTLKSEPKATTLTLKNDNSKSITVNNAVIQGAFGAVLIAIVIVAVLFWRRKNKK